MVNFLPIYLLEPLKMILVYSLIYSSIVFTYFGFRFELKYLVYLCLLYCVFWVWLFVGVVIIIV